VPGGTRVACRHCESLGCLRVAGCACNLPVLMIMFNLLCRYQSLKVDSFDKPVNLARNRL
jgi:hypothetical protein